MDHGRIQQKARPEATYRQPKNAFVANFIGVTNFIEGTVAGVDGDRIALDRSGLAGRPGNGFLPVAGVPARGALRAEQIRIAGGREALGDVDTMFDGTVTDTIFEGERVVYEVAVADLGGTTLRVFDHDPVAHSQHDVGSTVALGWNVKDVLVFGD